MGNVGNLVLGAVLTLAGTFGAKAWDEWRQRRALRAAFGAEIDGILKITEVRKHEEFFGNMVKKWKEGKDFSPTLIGMREFPKDPVYDKNVDKIGMLGVDAADVVLFYTNLRAIRVVMFAMAHGELKAFTPEMRAAIVEPNLLLWLDYTKPLGNDLVTRLRPLRIFRRYRRQN